MAGLGDDQRWRRKSPELIGRCITSFIFASLTQVALLIVPNFFPSFSLLSQLLLSAVVVVIAIGLGQRLRRVIGIRASAPAFVLFHILFIWMLYIYLIRHAVSLSMDIILNGELAMLMIGFFRILASDPGFVSQDSPASLLDSVSDGTHEEELTHPVSGIFPSTEATSLSSRRVRYCRSCKAFIRGFDHHCPAFGNCIGQKNYVLFLALLVGFIATEASYVICSHLWIKRYLSLNESNVEIYLYGSVVLSTLLFCLLQVLWQVFFLAWHFYCVCVNIRTDEWINWRRYPEFHVSCQLSLGQSVQEITFRNPYNKGIFQNLKHILLTHD